MKHWSKNLSLFGLLLLVHSGLALGLTTQPPTSIEGFLTVVWVDPQHGQKAQPELLFILSTEDGRNLEILPSDESENLRAELWRLRFRQVQVDLKSPEGIQVPGVVTVKAVRVDPNLVSKPDSESPASEPLIGNRPWISLLCKYSDIADEPRPPSFYSEMYDNSPGRLDHFWREVSYDNMDLVGSTVDGWRTLPNPSTYYIPDGGPHKLFELADDCIAVADPFVDFSNGGDGFQGINMFFNGRLDAAGYGGPMRRTLDGVTKVWGITWLSYGGTGLRLVEHEMGHGFGLPHSNNSDRDGWTYDNPWDVMSGGYSVPDPDFNSTGPHTHTFHKDLLGWVGPETKLEADSPGLFRINLDPVGAVLTSNFRMAKVPVKGSDSHFYTIEARETSGNYEAYLPGTAVIICEVLLGRLEPCWVVDADEPPADVASTEGVMWKVGEVFIDPTETIFVGIDSATEMGFAVSIYQATIFADGFESGDTSGW